MHHHPDSTPDEPRLLHDSQAEWTLVSPMPHHAETVASWPTSAAEAGLWSSRSEHPLPASAIVAGWERSDVQPWLLLDPDGVPAAYGEIWDDEEEDEQELARLIVDPARRRTGIGRRLIGELTALAKASGRSTCFLRVRPDNDRALSLYRACGFREVNDLTAAQWNHGQPVQYRWLEHPAFPGAGQP